MDLSIGDPGRSDVPAIMSGRFAFPSIRLKRLCGGDVRLYRKCNEDTGLTENLIRLTYVSTFQPDITDTNIDDLVAKAASFNQAQGITGVLAIDKERVCQILEGPKDHVERLFRSIQNDRRHHTVTEIDTRPIDAKSFEAWGMVRRDMIDIVIHALA